MITKEQKKQIVKELGETLAGSKSVVFANFHGLTVGDASSIRRALKAEGVGYKVAKKTLVKIALDEASLKGQRPELSGELALASGEDLVAPARMIFEFQKKLDKKISILGGIFSGEYKSQSEMIEIAMIPPLQILRGMFVNVINSPIQRVAISFSEIAKLKV